MTETIRIWVGCAPNNEDLESQAVLEWSLRKYASMPLDITWMQLSRDPESFWYSNPTSKRGWNTYAWSTPFSGFRWAVPYACEFEGKAIYMDSDMIVRADIADLWTQKFNATAPVISKDRNNAAFCVALFDCQRMKRYMPSLDQLRTKPLGYHKIRSSVMSVAQPFIGNWNCRDGEHYTHIDDPDIKVFHYTSIPHQLHLKHSISRLKAEGNKHWYTGKTQPHWRQGAQEMFDKLLIEAAENGYGIERYRREPFGEYRIRWGQKLAA